MKKLEKDKLRHAAAAHAMQSGVLWQMTNAYAEAGTQPKHLRVGINAAMSDHSGLVYLLIAKGLITEEEYFEAIADAMECERRRYENLLPNNVTLA